MFFLVAQILHFKVRKTLPFGICIMRFFNYLFFLMAPNFLALANTSENLGARWLLAKKVNFVPCKRFIGPPSTKM